MAIAGSGVPTCKVKWDGVRGVLCNVTAIQSTPVETAYGPYFGSLGSLEQAADLLQLGETVRIDARGVWFTEVERMLRDRNGLSD